MFGDETECASVRVWVFFFSERIWANQKIRLLSITTSEWLFWAVIWKVALDISRCPGKTFNRLQKGGCPSSDREAFTCTHTNHYSSLFLWTVLLSVDASSHVPFFSFFCLIWPGNVSPKSMYKIIWKLLIYKTMYNKNSLMIVIYCKKWIIDIRPLITIRIIKSFLWWAASLRLSFQRIQCRGFAPQVYSPARCIKMTHFLLYHCKASCLQQQNNCPSFVLPALTTTSSLHQVCGPVYRDCSKAPTG